MGLSLEWHEQHVMLVLSGDMAFASGTGEIDGAAHEALDPVATVMTALSRAKAVTIAQAGSPRQRGVLPATVRGTMPGPSEFARQAMGS